MKTSSMTKPDFLDEVEEEMDQGAKGGEDAYGADLEEDEEEDEEAAGEDRILAAKQVAKALGLTIEDPARLADALRTLIKSCT